MALPKLESTFSTVFRGIFSISARICRQRPLFAPPPMATACVGAMPNSTSVAKQSFME